MGLLWLKIKRGERLAQIAKVDTNLGGFDVVCFLLVFERRRGEIAERALVPRRVVERRDIVGDGNPEASPAADVMLRKRAG